MFDEKSVLFDGVNEYVNFGNVLGFERTDAFSWSFWIKAASLPAVAAFVIAKGAGTPSYRGCEISYDPTGQIYFSLYSDVAAVNYLQVRTQAVLPAGAWKHVCVTYDGSSDASGVAVYVNGASRPLTTVSNTLSGTVLNAASLNFMRRSDATYYASGNLDEVAVYGKELSAAEALWIWNLGSPRDLAGAGAPSDLVGWWRMGDGDTYPTLEDSGGTPYSPLTTCVDLNNDVQDEYVTFGHFSEVDFSKTTPFSAGLWVKYSGTNPVYMMSKRLGSGAGWEIKDLGGLDAGNFLVQLADSTASFYKRRAAGINDGAWHLLLFTYDGSNSPNGISLYVDGVLGAGATSGSPLSGNLENTGTLRVGALDSWPSNEFIGKVLHSFVYNKKLSMAEVTVVYGNGVPQDLAAAGPSSNLVHWAALGDGDAIGAGNVVDLSGFGHDGTAINVESGDFVADVPSEDGRDGTMVNMEAGDIVLDAPIPPLSRGQNVLPMKATIQDEGTSDGRTVKDAVRVGEPEIEFRYKMRGQDNGAPPPGYVTWVATFEDFLGAESAGSVPPIVGGLIPGSVRVVSEWPLD